MAADILVMTGDIIHYGSDHIASAGEFLAKLQARLGKYACMGNHDYYDEAGGSKILAMLSGCGFETLVNSAIPIEDNGNRLWMSGVDDIKYGRPDIPKALAFSSQEDEPVLMLAHNPLTLDPVAYFPGKTVHLMLSGHTHAGHVYLPFLDPVYRSWFKLKYRYGRYQTGDTQLYLTSGLGSAAVYYYGQGFSMACPRFRFNTWPEIVEITLTAG
jgi:predicted MPP superfamily phosphohydrolase